MLHALNTEANGVRHPTTKTLSGFGDAQVSELREWASDGTYRLVFTLRVRDCLYVLHAFQKKSLRGGATSQKDMKLIRERLKTLNL